MGAPRIICSALHFSRDFLFLVIGSTSHEVLCFLLLRSDDVERLLRGAWAGGFNLGTGLVAFGNVPRLSAYPPDHEPRSHHICHIAPLLAK